MFPDPVDGDITLDPSFSIVLPNILDIVGCICGDDHGMTLHFRNLKRFEGWFVKPEIMDVCKKTMQTSGGPS